MSTLIGTQGEERRDFSKAEQRELRRRSMRLLGSLLAPLKQRLVLTAIVVVISTGLQVIGPAIGQRAHQPIDHLGNDIRIGRDRDQKGGQCRRQARQPQAQGDDLLASRGF